MKIQSIFSEKINEIDTKVSKTGAYDDMVSLSKDIYYGVKEKNIINKIECCPNEMNHGCVCFHVSTLPEDVVLKLWLDSESYYAGFYQKYSDLFDQLIPRTINEQGIMILNDINDAKERILDFLANQWYARENKEIIS